MTRRIRGTAILITASMFILWFVLGGSSSAANILAGCAVAAAVGVWAPMADF